MRKIIEYSAHDYNQYYRGTVVFFLEDGLTIPLYVQEVDEDDEPDFRGITHDGTRRSIFCTECYVYLPDVFVGSNGNIIGSSSYRGHKKGLTCEPDDLLNLFRVVNLSKPRKFSVFHGNIQYLGVTVGFVHRGENYLMGSLLTERFKTETLQEAVCLEL